MYCICMVYLQFASHGLSFFVASPDVEVTVEMQVFDNGHSNPLLIL